MSQASLGSFPVISGDVAVYVLNGGFGYYGFSSGTNMNATTTQPHGLTTNGAIIGFSSGSPETIKYYDTSAAAGSRAIVDTGLQGRYPSITQYTIAFEDLTVNPVRIRYYDLIRNRPAPPEQALSGN